MLVIHVLVLRSATRSVLRHTHCVHSPEKNRQVDLIAISDLVSIHKVECIVIGLPISLDGSIGTQAEKVQKFAERLKTCN